MEMDMPAEATAITFSEDSEVDFPKKIKHRNHVGRKLIAEFFSNSSLHGVRYFCESSHHWAERVWWILAFGVSLFLCGYFILKMWTKWEETPVIVTFAEQSMPVWSIPFPAVTICPVTKTSMEKLNFTNVVRISSQGGLDNLTNEELIRVEAVTQICDECTLNYDFGNFTESSIVDILKDVAPTLNDTMVNCEWRHTPNHCSEYFQPILTEVGLCFTFNALSPQDIYSDQISPEFITAADNPRRSSWTLEKGYNGSDKEYPFSVVGAGVKAGLTTLLRVYEKDMEYMCRGPLQGFQVLLHTPGEVPQLSKHFFHVPLSRKVFVSIKPNLITISDSLRHYKPKRRKCYFNSERLRFFKVYTQRNCELECLSNITKAMCGCVKFSMPRDNDTKICAGKTNQCIIMAEYIFAGKVFTNNQTDFKCNCLPACSSITYDTEITQVESSWNGFSVNDQFELVEPESGEKWSELTISFKENQFIPSRRSELYGVNDFIASCGGLLGLFLGVSILSIVEVIYYCTLRLGCALRQRRSNDNSIRVQKNAVAPAEPGTMIVTPTAAKKCHQN